MLRGEIVFLPVCKNGVSHPRNLWNKCRRNVTVEPLLCLVWFPFGLAFGSGGKTRTTRKLLFLCFDANHFA